ncbi:hypothetical protein [Spirosoma linguale]|uniref:Uncharacterized protein n=1 Tax=Spirosoma linguale (strain ATCC 33905 / DSM 74 / LMG 10896 / Claus 1) TaxID=504472 RepID=D2QV80_SPILD|nr:hypothetical protein Slin_6758 [Spirosoma linguale DSM 74]
MNRLLLEASVVYLPLFSGDFAYSPAKSTTFRLHIWQPPRLA